MSTDVRILLVSAPEAIAPRLAEALLESRLAACATLLAGGVSRYRWEGKLETARESIVLFKTTAAAAAAAREKIRELHPYEVPEILELAVDAGHPAYLEWVRSACR